MTAIVAYRDTLAGHRSTFRRPDISVSPVQSECSFHGRCTQLKHRALFSCPPGSHSHVRDQVRAHSPHLQIHLYLKMCTKLSNKTY
jgi:hypothetical protein